MITGINHVTLAVSDLSRSVDFYADLLGCRLIRRRPGSAYLKAGELWLCLSVDPEAESAERPDYTHLAFSVPASGFAAAENRLKEAGVTTWKQNRSEGDSVYFLDPDRHKLEIHVGTLESRLASLAAAGEEPPETR